MGDPQTYTCLEVLRIDGEYAAEHVRCKAGQVSLQEHLAQPIVRLYIPRILTQNIPEMSQSLEVPGGINQLVYFFLIRLQGDLRHDALLKKTNHP